MNKALFLSNSTYFDTSKREGGVRNCTMEFIELLSARFELIYFPVNINITYLYRIYVKFGLNDYADYRLSSYEAALGAVLEKHDIGYVFLNLSNTAPFAELIKRITHNKVKVYLCSHGNESGDYLHQVVKFGNTVGTLKRYFSSFTIGSMLKKESFWRLHYLDGVMCVSEVEEAIEKWIGAKKTFMVPRLVKAHFLKLDFVLGRVGFMGDLSHTPNYEGVIALCKALESSPLAGQIQVRLVGGPEKIGHLISEQYPFVHYCGFLSEEAVEKEVATWCLFLNIAWYYSRGVSTKLGKALNWGLPIATTSIGLRGYNIDYSGVCIVNTPEEMVSLIENTVFQPENLQQMSDNTRRIVVNAPDSLAIWKLIDAANFFEAVK